MIYILSFKAADERNRKEAARLYEDTSLTTYEWDWIDFGDYRALLVEDGNGLTDEELSKCESMPDSFDGYIPQRFRGIENVVVTDFTSQSYCDVSAEINGVQTQFNGYYYKNDYWDNYTVMEWIVDEMNK